MSLQIGFAGLLVGSAAGAVQVPLDRPTPIMVFFDWGKPALSGDATAALDAILAGCIADRDCRLRIEGHADRSGDSAVNLSASKRRADVVAAYFVAHGVPRQAIIEQAFGESRPIIVTDDGVREPQNRRVEIFIEASRR